MPLYVLSAFITLIGLYNTNKEFKFVESTFITFVNTYIKGFALEVIKLKNDSFICTTDIPF
jgi:hypothetical protein